MPPLQRNIDSIVGELRSASGGLTRDELADRTGLSRPTVSAVVQELVADGTVVERAAEDNGSDPSSPGRRAGVLDLARGEILLGIDFGRSHLRVAVADRAGELLVQDEKACDVDTVGAAALGDAIDLIADLFEDDRSFNDVVAVGVGLPAPINEHGFVASSEFLPTWATTDVDVGLRIAIDERRRNPGRAWEKGALPDDCIVTVANDASLGARAEAADAGMAGGDVLYVKASSSISAGLILSGAAHLGAHRRAGTLAHVAVPAEAERLVAETSQLVLPRHTCTVCGRLDCLENLASGRAVVRQLRATHPAYAADLDIETVVRSATSDADQHPMCSQAIGFAGLRLGFVLADVIRLLDPELILIGGWFSHAGDIFLRPVRDAVRRAGVRADDQAIRLVPEGRVVRSEVEGAVLLALEAVTQRAVSP